MDISEIRRQEAMDVETRDRMFWDKIDRMADITLKSALTCLVGTIIYHLFT